MATFITATCWTLVLAAGSRSTRRARGRAWLRLCEPVLQSRSGERDRARASSAAGNRRGRGRATIAGGCCGGSWRGRGSPPPGLSRTRRQPGSRWWWRGSRRRNSRARKGWCSERLQRVQIMSPNQGRPRKGARITQPAPQAHHSQVRRSTVNLVRTWCDGGRRRRNRKPQEFRAGDVQWMTAGSGILHQETPQGDPRGRMHGFQLWANLPSSLKMTAPRYQVRPCPSRPTGTLSPRSSRDRERFAMRQNRLVS
jgi:Pirin